MACRPTLRVFDWAYSAPPSAFKTIKTNVLNKATLQDCRVLAAKEPVHALRAHFTLRGGVLDLNCSSLASGPQPRQDDVAIRMRTHVSYRSRRSFVRALRPSPLAAVHDPARQASKAPSIKCRNRASLT